MNIGVNLFLTSPRSVTGAFVYIQHILPALFHADTKHTFYLFGESESINYFKSLYGHLPNVRFRVVGITHDLFIHPARAIKKLVAKITHDYRTSENIVAREVNEMLCTESIDVYFSPASLYPHGVIGVGIVTTIYDLQPEYFPDNFPPSYLERRKEDCTYVVAHSSRLIAISEYTKKSLQEMYGVTPKKIKVIYLAPQEIKKGSVSLKTPQEFLLYPAALWPHKNHRVLIKALGILKDRFPSLQMVCTGMTKGRGLKDELEAMAEAEGLKERVLFLGFVSDAELYSLYTGAKALVYPSAFEGFGIPLVEAFQLGLPVVAADNSSITEVVNGAGILVPTGDAEALARAIERVLTDSNLRDTLIQKGRERAKMFSWGKTARETLEIFHSIAAR